MIHIQHFTFNDFQTRCCVVWDDSLSCAFVDPGCSSPAEIAELTSFVSKHGLTAVCIMLTHGHFDHVLGVSELSAKYQIPVFMHPADRVTLANNEYFCKWFGAPLPAAFETTDLCEGSVIEVGSLRFEVIETPGHTPGGVSFYERSEKVLFSGDTLFEGAIGRTDHPGGDYEMLMKSILEKLVTLKGEVSVIPGHGPCTDIAREGMTNPFLLPFNEAYED